MTLRVRLKRMADGASALHCTRADGSETWQRLRGAAGAVFPAHDLTHLAVETTLGYTGGFFGLVAAGWDLADFAAPWPRGPIPAEAREVELLVGVFDMEWRAGRDWTPDALREQGARYAASLRDPLPFPPLSDDAIAAVRAARAALLARWAAVPPGATLEVAFTPGVRG